MSAKNLASSLCGVHFCLIDDIRTWETTHFIHNLAWSLSNFEFNAVNGACGKRSSSFQQILNENNSNLLKKLANVDISKWESENTFKKCFVEPLEHLTRALFGHGKKSYVFVLVDAVDCGYGSLSSSSSSLSTFLLKNLELFPKWLKLLLTTRNFKRLLSVNGTLLKNYELIDLEAQSTHHYYLNKDLNDYISYRVNKSNDIQKNILNLNSNSSNSPSMSPPLPTANFSNTSVA